MTIVVPIRINYFNCFEAIIRTLEPEQTDAARIKGNSALHAFALDNYPLGAVRFEALNWHEGSNTWNRFMSHSRGLSSAAVEARKFSKYAKLDQGRDRA